MVSGYTLSWLLQWMTALILITIVMQCKNALNSMLWHSDRVIKISLRNNMRLIQMVLWPGQSHVLQTNANHILLKLIVCLPAICPKGGKKTTTTATTNKQTNKQNKTKQKTVLWADKPLIFFFWSRLKLYRYLKFSWKSWKIHQFLHNYFKNILRYFQEKIS